MAKQGFGRSSALIAAGTLTSRVLGLMRQMLLVYAIGSLGFVANSYSAATRIPGLVYSLVITGALTAVLVPQITKAALAKDRGQAYIQKLITLSLVVGSALTLLTALISPLIVRLLTPDWSAEHRGLALAFALWLAPQVLFFVLYTVAGEVLNAKSVFGPYTWAPVLNNVIHISALLLFIYFFGADPNGERVFGSTDFAPQFLIAGAASLGVAAQAIVLLFAFKRAGIKMQLDFKWRGFGLGEIGRVASWTLASMVATQITGIYQGIAMNRAQSGEAGLAAVELATLILSLPHATIVVSLVMASFTSMSEKVQNGDEHGYRMQLRRAFSLTVLITAPIIAIFALLSFPISRVLQPTADSAVVGSVAIVLLALSISQLPYSLVFVLNRGFFARSNTKTPFLLNVLHTSVIIILVSFTFAFETADAAWLACLAVSFGYILFYTLTHLTLKRHIGAVLDAETLKDSLRALFATAAAILLALLLMARYVIPDSVSVLGITLQLDPLITPLALPNVIGTEINFVGSILICVVVGILTLALYVLFLLISGHSATLALRKKLTHRQSRP
ncbi:murein biosynthesis integral membrane protein MurJ [Canibacter zhoujuaniae]|uniref:murein biosynthesis integral membrane protein MurJ n=1 Tax=Canibacter zhoujuaniae TaxID=2708343 RepID=UPI00142442A0|nr:lipid II flippase MurJ [Canibacter zhoujuaniae]